VRCRGIVSVTEGRHATEVTADTRESTSRRYRNSVGASTIFTYATLTPT
jgi:hypothetical protein